VVVVMHMRVPCEPPVSDTQVEGVFPFSFSSPDADTDIGDNRCTGVSNFTATCQHDARALAQTRH
jgi:hypothetical protein